MQIEEAVTFIKATREEAVTQAYEMGGGEVHALHISKGFGMPTTKPIGYLVIPQQRPWVDEADIRADEREACAKVCESRATPGTGSVAILNGAADAIRARGNA